ncbi:hypothetical protein NECAME_06842 [Necator americanus]|uniref:Uncharacterized protein n=1 Tax=Necator americanus TaxID=51031 RepID=W2TTU5_NECAM|nr:hypothetical protein NECAME_06842 [Necator americanus]ETN84521.1 hypothetical protein NECAME_06842 [Necator americanus]
MERGLSLEQGAEDLTGARSSGSGILDLAGEEAMESESIRTETSSSHNGNTIQHKLSTVAGESIPQPLHPGKP